VENFFLVAIDDGARVIFSVVRCRESDDCLSGEFGPKKGRKKCIYICIYTSVCIDVVACVEPTQPVPNGVPNE